MERIEEYLEAIFRLKESNRPLTTGNLSKVLGIAPASVTQMLKKLFKLGYISYVPYQEVSLTAKGEKIGRKVLRKHRVAERFLRQMGIPEAKVHEQACELEHHLPDELERAIHRKTEGEKLHVPKRLLPLTALLEGEEGVVERLVGGRGLCERLSAMGLTPGTKVRVLRSSLFRGPLLISVRGTELALGRGVAEKILLRRD
ncbi:MAG: metal-dependent transcriptional regulator [Candidatus Hadarchaeales archaeon]